MILDIYLLTALLLVSLWTVMTIRLIRAVAGLALISVVLSIIMFRLNANLAAVFELSVCAGLISVIFFTTVSFTHRITPEKLLIRRKERLAKFLYLPLIIVIALIILLEQKVVMNIKIAQPYAEHDVRNILWNIRHLDLLGQIMVLLIGAFGVVVLFKEKRK